MLLAWVEGILEPRDLEQRTGADEWHASRQLRVHGSQEATRGHKRNTALALEPLGFTDKRIDQLWTPGPADHIGRSGLLDHANSDREWPRSGV